MTRRNCAVKNCTNSSNDKTLHFFRFPKETERLDQWLRFCELDDLSNKETNYCYYNFRLCSAHFEPQMFSNVQKNKLLAMAVPTLKSLTNSDKLLDVTVNGNKTETTCIKKLRSSKIFTKLEKQETLDFLEISDNDEKKDLRELIIENNRVNLLKDQTESCDSSNSILKEEMFDQENFIILKSQDSNESNCQNSDLPKLNCAFSVNESQNLVANGTTTAPQWIILVSSEANKISSPETNPTTVISMDTAPNLTQIPGIFPSNPPIPTIPTLDPTFMQPLGMSQPLAVLQQQNFMNSLPMDSNLNNQWIILLNSTGPNTSVTNTLTNSSATLISGQTNNILQNPLPALPTVPTISSLPQTLPQLPTVVPNILNNSTGLTNPLQTPADWIVVVSTTASETDTTPTQTLQFEMPKTFISTESENILSYSSQNGNSNVKACISFETKSVTSNSMSISAMENNSCQPNGKNNGCQQSNQRKKVFDEPNIFCKNGIDFKTKVAKKSVVESEKIFGISKFLKSCKKFLSPEMFQLVKIHLIYKKKSLKYLKNVNKFKNFAFKMNSISPQAYKYCADILKLPSKKSLKNIP